MTPHFRLTVSLVTGLMLVGLSGCRSDKRQDTLISSVANPSHTYRATIILRQYYVDGKYDDSPTTYVLVDRDEGTPDYRNGADFTQDQVIMQPAQCGPLSLAWTEEHTLKIRCEKCGIALSAVGQHARNMGQVHVDYEGFPDMSSWETAPRTN